MANTVTVARVSALQGQAYAKDKAGNLRRIASMLDLGLDSLVFVDHNPAERDIDASASRNSSGVISPAFTASENFQRCVPDPTRSPL